MKNTRKILVALLVVFTLLMSMMTVTAFAVKTTGDTTLYLKPNSNWQTDNARYAVYTWDIGNTWFDMTDSDGDGIYECVIPAGIENIIFCRMNPNTTENNWNNKWNQTGDLKYDGTNNCCSINDGQWDCGLNVTWSLIETDECIHAPSGEGSVITAATCTENGEVSHTCSKCGETYTAAILATGHSYGADGKCANCDAEVVYIIAGDVMQVDSAYQAGDNSTLFGTSWDVTNEANKLEYNAETGCFEKVYTNVAAGEYNFKVTVDKSWNVSYGENGGQNNCYVNVAEDGMTVTISFKDGVPSATADHLMSPDDPDPTPDPEKVYVIAGDVMMDADGAYVAGVNFLGTSWDVTNENNLLAYDEELGCYVKVYENVSIGEYHFKIAENMAWTVSYGENGGQDNCYVSVKEEGSTVTIMFKDGIPSAEVTAPEAPIDPDPTPNPDPTPDTDPTPDPDHTPDPEQPGDDTPEQPEEPVEELTLVQKILKAITDFFKNIGGWFKNLFGGLKK